MTSGLGLGELGAGKAVYIRVSRVQTREITGPLSCVGGKAHVGHLDRHCRWMVNSVDLELAGQIRTWEGKWEVTDKAVGATIQEIRAPAPRVRRAENTG